MKFAVAITILVVSAALARAETAVTVPHFEDETKTSGLHSIYTGKWQYMVGGGAAVFDCNGDGLPEIYVAGGENASRLFINHSKHGGALKFEETKSGAELKQVTGAYPVDIDSDGVMDLVVLRVGESKVFRGLGQCKFEDATARWKLDGGNAWSTAFSAIWEKGNRWPTLAFGTYIDPKFEDEPWGHCSDNWLLRPAETQNAFASRSPLMPSYCALSMLFTDWNRSGTPSLRVANDREYYQGGQEQMWKIPPGQSPSLYTLEEGWKYQRFWGMGIASADLKQTGYPAYFVTSMADQRLQFLSDDPTRPSYKDAPFSMGTSAHRPFTGGDERPSTGWHAQFEDVNNDGLYDLFIAKGNVEKMPDFAEKDPSNLLLQKPDGNFIEGAEKANLLNFGQARGAAIADFNLDGKMDALIINRNENLRIWRNVSTDLGHWLGIRLQQTTSNRDGIGAWIEVKRGDKIIRREISVGGGHVSGVNSFWHFGLGASDTTQIRVLWPDGKTGEWIDVKADQFYLVAPDAAPKPWTAH